VGVDSYDKHRAELRTIVEPLKALGIACVNASPCTVHTDLWPLASLDSFL